MSRTAIPHAASLAERRNAADKDSRQLNVPWGTRLSREQGTEDRAERGTDGTADRIRAVLRGGGELAPDVERSLSMRFGHNLGDIRIHADNESDSLARSVEARAFTSGRDIFFRHGVYEPGSRQGLRALAHEIAHVDQQSAGPVLGSERIAGLSISEPSDVFEQAAEREASRVVDGDVVQTSQFGSRGPAVTASGLLPIQRDADPSAAAVAPVPSPVPSPAPTAATPMQASTDGQQEASTFEGDAAAFFENNLRVSLRNALAVEGVAIGRRAAFVVGKSVRDVCEPFERDQEIDTQILNTVFAVAGGGASVTEAGTSGKIGDPSRGANIGSRIFRMGLGVVNSITPMLAGYKTVGALKDAAVRNMGEEAASGGETGAPGYHEYESDALSNLRDVDWQQMIDASKEKIKVDPNPAVARQIATGMLPALLTQYQDKVRSEYGARSSAADAMEASIAQSLAPKMETLKEHLEDAQAHRKHVQELEAIGGGIAGGAAIGAGLGLLGGPFAPLTVTAGAIGGAIIGGVIGAIGAAAIAWN